MELLKRLTNAFSPSGNEGKICNIIFDEIKDFSDEIYRDTLGNLIVRKKGNGKKIMFAAHMDEIGVIATYTDDKGFIRFSNIGWVDPFYALYQKVRFENGTIGVISYEESIPEIKELKLDKMFIDIGAKDKADSLSKVKIGDTAQFVSDFYVSGDRVISKTLDNRAGVYILIEALKEINSDNDLYFVFTVQEEVGLKGAKTSVFDINPDYAIAVDVTDTGDTPKCKYMSVALGNGPTIKVKDQSVITDYDLRKKMEDIAEKNNIPYQLEVLESGGTDAGSIHVSRSGVKTGAVSLPTRYVHSMCELADVSDIKNAITFVKKLSAEL